MTFAPCGIGSGNGASSIWYVIHTAPRAEQKAAKGLQRQGFEVYVPMADRKKRIHRRTGFRIVKCPAFPRYLFIASNGAMNWQSVHETSGVSGIVCMNDAPIRMFQSDIDDVKAAEDMGMFSNITERAEIKIGDQVLITYGPLEGYQAVVAGIPDSLKEGSKVRAELPMFGQLSTVIVPIDRLKGLA